MNNKSHLSIIKTLIFTAMLVAWPLNALAQSGGVDALQKEIDQRKQQIEELQKQQDAYQAQIDNYRKQASSLNAQVGALNSQISRTQLKLQSTQLQIQQTELEIQQTQENIKLKESEINAQKQRIANIFIAIDRIDQRDNIVQLIIGGNNLGDTFAELAEFERIHSSLKDQLSGLQQLKDQLDKQQTDLTDKNTQLADYQDSLESQRAQLSGDKYAKQTILDKTKGNQKKYEALLADLKAQEAQINNEISAYEQKIRQQLNQKGQLPTGIGKIQWPISSRVITATFHDPDYPFRKVMEHPAIDIRTPQGTAIKAAADGYVGRAKDGGRYGYSYILLVHGGNISTVYGHVSRIVVAEDTFVSTGQIIGYSGGTPGTPGAGPMTTGPHLHFEVRLNGIPVDPLKYL